MHQEKESLSDLLDNLNYYIKILDKGPPKKSDLMRFYISNWQYNLGKMENSYFKFIKNIYERKAKEYKQKFDFLFPDIDNHFLIDKRKA